MSFHVPEKYRINHGPLKSDTTFGNNGAFFIPFNRLVFKAKAIASDGMGWEHVSVSFPDRTPLWEEMCRIKDMFWDEEDCVIQYHPPKSQYRNLHPFCLHLWRPIVHEIPMPLPEMVAPLYLRMENS